MSQSDEDKPLETLHVAIREMVDQQRQTNLRIDSTNERLDAACLEFRNGFSYLSKEQIRTNEKLDVTNAKLDATITTLVDFKVHVSKRLDGVGTYLMSIDDQLHSHEKWLRRLDDRLYDQEKWLRKLDERMKPGETA